MLVSSGFWPFNDVHFMLMKPTIIDQDTGRELWTASECAEFSGTARGTFTSYAGRGKAPTPATKMHGLTLWDSDDIKEWHDGRLKRREANKESK